ncbi:unnamed protein product, partial [Symbiodinium sp. KB8]
MSRASGEEGNATQSIANDTFDSGALTPEPLTKQKSSLEQSESWPSWVDSFASVVAVFKALQSRSSLPAALIEEQWKALRDEHMGSFLLVMRGLPAVGATVPDTRIASPSTPGSPRPTPKPSTPAGGKEEKQEKEGKKPSTVTAQHVIDAVQAILQDQGLRVAQQHSIRLVKDMESEAGKGTAALIRIIDDRRLSRVMGKLQGSTHNLQMVEPSIDMSFKISANQISRLKHVAGYDLAPLWIKHFGGDLNAARLSMLPSPWAIDRDITSEEAQALTFYRQAYATSLLSCTPPSGWTPSSHTPIHAIAGLSREAIACLSQLHTAFDEDQDGKLNEAELQRLLQCFGPKDAEGAMNTTEYVKKVLLQEKEGVWQALQSGSESFVLTLAQLILPQCSNDS